MPNQPEIEIRLDYQVNTPTGLEARSAVIFSKKPMIYAIRELLELTQIELATQLQDDNPYIPALTLTAFYISPTGETSL